MAKLNVLIARLGQLSEMIEPETLAIIKKHEETATNMNTDQLFAGEDAHGVKLPDYSERSITVFGKPAGPMRLFESGDFYRGFFLDTSKFPVIVFSSDSKTGKIADLLSSKGHNPDSIYGLNKSNLADFSRSYVLPDLQRQVRELLGV